MNKLIFPALIGSTLLVGCAGTEWMELDGNRYFEITQVLKDGSMLARRCTDIYNGTCLGNVVLLDKCVDSMPWDKKILHLKNPQVVRTFSYINKKNQHSTVPVIVDKQ